MHAAKPPVPREGLRESATWGWRADGGADGGVYPTLAGGAPSGSRLDLGILAVSAAGVGGAAARREGVFRERGVCLPAEEASQPLRRARADRLPGVEDPDQGRGPGRADGGARHAKKKRLGNSDWGLGSARHAGPDRGFRPALVRRPRSAPAFIRGLRELYGSWKIICVRKSRSRSSERVADSPSFRRRHA